MQIIKPPKRFLTNTTYKFQIFLAGSIEMGKAEDWQTKIQKELSKEFKNKNNIYICNPRRDDWDSSWEQDINNQQFFEQVTWELDQIKKADLVVIYFDKDTQSPITLLELGIVAESGIPAIVCCPKGFWRKGNVDIVCERYSIPVVTTMENLIAVIKKEINGDI